MQTTNLTARRAAEIANSYGFRLRRVRKELELARRYHGDVERGSDGIIYKFDARSLFEHYVSGLAGEIRCEEREAAHHEWEYR
ncbi:MAG: hypothetical protein KGS44_13245 [Alphaproteobacteria bacterium]|nr:hypothetical protein [Alphaproteobacteria bacterium]